MSCLEQFDWQRLFHAYGVAEDTPEYLQDLGSADSDDREAAIDHLYSAVLHQGTIYSATPAAVEVVLELLAQREAFAKLENGDQTVASLVSFLADVGDSVRQLADVMNGKPPALPTPAEIDKLFEHLRDDDDGEDDEGWGSPLIGVLMEHAAAQLQGLGPQAQAVLVPLLNDASHDVRMQAINAAGQWGTASAQAAEVMTRRLDVCDERDERASLVLALGLLGRDVSRWLGDDDEAIRACAALFVPGAAAEQTLITALSRPEQVDGWFAEKPAFFPMHVRFRLLGRLIEQQVTLEALLPAALPLLARTAATNADYEWGPILRLAFPEQAAAFKPGLRPPLPQQISPAQHAVVDALLKNDGLWDPRQGNASLARMVVGLPNGRDDVAAYLKVTPVTA